ncbi:permease-like cell division protein FtsX [Endothiovibrio diazotrophicus]
MFGGRNKRRGATRLERKPANDRRGGATPRPRPAEAATNKSVGPTPPLKTRALAWFVGHFRALLASLGHLWRNLGSGMMTAGVIGIALALPAGLYILLDNLQAVSRGWDGEAQISLFLQPRVSDREAAALADRLRPRPGIGQVSVVSHAQALEEFRQLSGFGEALGLLDGNPLPAVILVTPTASYDSPQAVEGLLRELRALPEVDLAQLDLEWVKRLHALTEIARRGVLVVAGLLALAVLLIVGNTIRLDIQNRRDEIVITKLIGGTDAFIRRPFLYGGFWYGATGGLVAWLLVGLSFQMIDGPVARLAALYGSPFQLNVLTFGTTFTLFAIAIALGLLGSWLAVGRHLRQIEPT